MKLNNVVVLTADKPNLNGHFYPLEELTKIVENCKGKQFPGMIGMPSFSTLNNNLSITDENLALSSEVTGLVDKQLLVNITILDTPKGILLKKLIEDINEPCDHFRTAGLCNIETANEKGTLVIKNYTLCSINYVNNPA